MPIYSPHKKNEIYTIIESIEDTLGYSSIEELKDAMKSIKFTLFDETSFSNSTVFKYKGIINNKYCYLNFLYYETTQNSYVVQKSFFLTDDNLIYHRDDSPAKLGYSIEGKLVEYDYMINGLHFRNNGMPVNFTLFQKIEQTSYRYKYKKNNYYVYVDMIVLSDDDEIINAGFYFQDFYIKYKNLIEFKPEIKNLNKKQLENIHEYLTEIELQLFEMANY